MWRRQEFERDFEREIRAHMSLEEEELREDGVPPAEAPYAARRAFGNVTIYREVMHEMWGWSSLERLAQDLRYAVRMMKKNPGFTLVAALSLALGIGGNTAIFSLMNAVILRSLPVSDPGRLTLFGKGHWSGIVDSMPNHSWQLFSRPFYREVQHQNEVFNGVAAMMSLPNDVRAAIGGGEPEPLHTRLVSGTYFDVLGVKTAIGRTFIDAEDQAPGAHPVAVMSYAWWQRRFAGDPGIVGKALTIGRVDYTIVGVAAPDFFGTVVGESPDLWIPLAMNGVLPPVWGGDKAMSDPLFQCLNIVGRLKPGVSMTQAQAQVNLLFKQNLRTIAGSQPSEKTQAAIRKAMIELVPGGRGLSFVRQRFSGQLRLLMTAVGLVLLIACANIANLLLARAANRQREIAIRLSVGAGRVRLVRQMLTESVLLALVGGAAGIGFAAWAGQLLVKMVSSGHDPLPLRVTPDARVLLFTALLSMATGILFGLAPALRATRLDLASTLKEARSASGLARTRGGLAKALIVSQVALSAMLLIAAGLFMRSLSNLRGVDTGFVKDHVLVLGLDTASLGYRDDDPRLTVLYRQLEQRVSQVPGVRSASLSMFVFQPGAWTTDAFASGGPSLPESQREIHGNVIGPRFFETMGLPVTLGRAFNAGDTDKSPKVAVINETMARTFFPGISPVGRRFGFSPQANDEFEVVGVVKDAKYESLRESPTPMAFYPDAQNVRFQGNFSLRYLGDARSILPGVRQAVAEVNSRLPIASVSTMADQVDQTLAGDKLIARLSTFFGLLALVLASVGIYGVLSYAVARRTSEVGLRMALGAPRANVIWLVMRDVVVLVAVGLAIGIPGALASQRLMASMLYEIAGVDPVAVCAAILTLTVVAGCAAYLPARRASRVDPTVALRYE